MDVKRYVDFDGEGGGTAEARLGERGQYVGSEDFDRVTAERDTLNARLTAADDHSDRLIAAINKMRKTVCLPASIEAVLIAAVDRKEKN